MKSIRRPYTKRNVAATAAAILAIARKRGASVVVLNGPLGAGKTTLAKAVLKAAGFSKPSRSPTFNVVNELREDQKIAYHIDVYRLLGSEADWESEIADYAARGDLVVTEWIEPGSPALAGRAIIPVRIGFGGAKRWIETPA